MPSPLSPENEVRELADKLERLANLLETRVLDALEQGAQILAQQVRANLREEGRSGRVYRTRGVEHQASAPGEAPASRTGELSDSIAVEPGATEGELHVVADTAYAAALEFGTHQTEPRPFLQPAFAETREGIKARVRNAARKSVPSSRV